MLLAFQAAAAQRPPGLWSMASTVFHVHVQLDSMVWGASPRPVGCPGCVQEREGVPLERAGARENHAGSTSMRGPTFMLKRPDAATTRPARWVPILAVAAGVAVLAGALAVCHNILF